MRIIIKFTKFKEENWSNKINKLYLLFLWIRILLSFGPCFLLLALWWFCLKWRKFKFIIIPTYHTLQLKYFLQIEWNRGICNNSFPYASCCHGNCEWCWWCVKFHTTRSAKYCGGYNYLLTSFFLECALESVLQNLFKE